MPTRKKEKKERKGLSIGKKSKRAKEQVVQEAPPEDELIEGLDPSEIEEEEAQPEVVVELARPFTGDVVSPVLKGLVVVPRVIGPEDANILKGFFHYFAATEPFFGSITLRQSFMHAKGGRLL